MARRAVPNLGPITDCATPTAAIAHRRPSGTQSSRESSANGTWVVTALLTTGVRMRCGALGTTVGVAIYSSASLSQRTPVAHGNNRRTRVVGSHPGAGCAADPTSEQPSMSHVLASAVDGCLTHRIVSGRPHTKAHTMFHPTARRTVRTAVVLVGLTTAAACSSSGPGSAAQAAVQARAPSPLSTPRRPTTVTATAAAPSTVTDIRTKVSVRSTTATVTATLTPKPAGTRTEVRTSMSTAIVT